MLIDRCMSIRIPSLIVPFKHRLSKGTLTILIRGGFRGGVSIALVRSVTDPAYKELLPEMTCFVVVFSIVVQGLTVSNISHGSKKWEK